MTHRTADEPLYALATRDLRAKVANGTWKPGEATRTLWAEASREPADATAASAMGVAKARTMDELFDMHCHLGFFPDVVTAARDLDAAGVGALCATVTPGEYERVAVELADAPNVRVGVGLHPWWVADGTCGEADVERAASLAATCRYVAEVGLDFARGRDATRDAQLRALDRMLAACGDGGHMLSVHAVRAASDVLDALERHGTVARGNVAVLHWFSGTNPELTHAIRLGCRFSVGPRMLATRRGCEYARQIPPERLLLETDLPASTGQGATLGPGELARELRQALDALCELHGPEVAHAIAAASRQLLEL